VDVREGLPSESFEQLAMPHFKRLYNFACWLTHDRIGWNPIDAATQLPTDYEVNSSWAGARRRARHRRACGHASRDPDLGCRYDSLDRKQREQRIFERSQFNSMARSGCL